MTVLFCTVFLLRGCYSELCNQRSTAFYCKNERNKPFIILISAYEGGVGHVCSQSRGRGQRKISGARPQNPKFFAPPQIKNPGGATACKHDVPQSRGVMEGARGLNHLVKVKRVLGGLSPPSLSI